MSVESGGLRVTAKEHCGRATQVHEDSSKLTDDQSPPLDVLDWRNPQGFQRGGAL